jgi:NAD(P)-dependent dehydrogenase (short-subunit alcohol dehydrogenase family)
MTATLITGASRGLGYETARRLLGAGHEIWMAARDPGRGAAAAETLGARFVQMDVTDDASVEAAARAVAEAGGLDVLINDRGQRTDHYAMTGDLTIKDHTRPVTLAVVKYGEFSDPTMGHRIGYGAETQILRKDFGLNVDILMDGRIVVGNETQITIQGELVEVAA